jgi:hypothetical protein
MSMDKGSVIIHKINIFIPTHIEDITTLFPHPINRVRLKKYEGSRISIRQENLPPWSLRSLIFSSSQNTGSLFIVFP